NFFQSAGLLAAADARGGLTRSFLHIPASYCISRQFLCFRLLLFSLSFDFDFCPAIDMLDCLVPKPKISPVFVIPLTVLFDFHTFPLILSFAVLPVCCVIM